MDFNGRRLSIARQRRMLSQKGFAERAGVSAHTVSRCEKGLHEPTDSNVEAFASVLGFPKAFFYSADVDRPMEASFRSQAAMTAALRDAALSAGSIGYLISDWVEQRFNLPAVDLPDLTLHEPEAAARVLREHWSLGERPISNMVHLLESKGVRVFSLTEETRRLNAFSIWRDSKPYVFLNTFKSAESSRFDAGHELAHLVLHQDGTSGRAAEDQANRFASSFLMPRASVFSRMPWVSGVDSLISHKSFWKVSVAALNYRAHKLDITSDWQYRDLCIQIAQRRYNTSEPAPIARETSVVWDKVLKLLWQDRKSIASLAAELALPETEVNSLVFGTLASGAQGRGLLEPLRLVTE